MKLQDLQTLAKALDFRRVSVGAGNLICSCPFARWRHAGNDRKPSFGIIIDDEGESCFNCFGCHSSGGLHDLVLELAELRRTDLSHLETWILDNEGLDISKKIKASERDRVFTVQQRQEASLLEAYPESEYDRFRGSVPRFALERGLTLEACKAWELGNCKEEKRLAFPVRRGSDKALVGVRGRTYVDARAKYFPLLPFNPSDFLYGEHMLRPADEEERVCVVEGEIDAIKCWMAGFSAIGLFGSHPSKKQRLKIECLNRPLVLLPDGDKVGRKWAQKLGEEFKFYVSVFDVRLRDGEDPGAFEPDELREKILMARVRV